MPDDSICALYYPNHPTDSVWLRHALLYYDYVGTTVPTDLEKDLDRWELPQHLKEVRDRGQYKPMLGPDNMQDVLAAVKDLDTTFEFAPLGLLFPDIPLLFLTDPSMVVDPGIGRLVSFPNLLAEIVAAHTPTVSVPFTDNQRAHRQMYSRAPNMKRPDDLANVVNIAYDMLPVPGPDVPLRKILTFKDRHRDELRRLRVALEAFRRGFQESEDPDQLKQDIRARAEEMRLGMNDLRTALKANGVLCANTAVKEILSTRSLAIAAGAAFFDAGFYLALTGALAIIGASISTSAIPVLQQRSSVRRTSPYSYLCNLQSKRIVP